MSGINKCGTVVVGEAGRLKDKWHNTHICIKISLIASIAFLAIGITAAWVPGMPSSLVSPFIKIGALLAGSLIFHKIMFMNKESKSKEGNRLIITLIASAILIVGSTTGSYLLTGAPAAMCQIGIYTGIPLLINSTMILIFKRCCSSRLERAIEELDLPWPRSKF